jgi:hypothetical protein
MVEEGVLQKTALKTIPARNRGEQAWTPGARRIASWRRLLVKSVSLRFGAPHRQALHNFCERGSPSASATFARVLGGLKARHNPPGYNPSLHDTSGVCLSGVLGGTGLARLPASACWTASAFTAQHLISDAQRAWSGCATYAPDEDRLPKLRFP